MTEVFVHLSRTVNLGNYESMKVDIGLTLSCEPEEVEEKYAECKSFVETKLNEKMHELQIGTT